MGTMALFDSITHVPLKDCFEDVNHLLIFVVNYQNLGQAVGKKAIVVKKLEYILKRKIRIIGFHPDVKEFVKLLIYPLRVALVELHENVIILTEEDRKTKSLLIGRNAQNLRNTESIVQRYFPDIKEIKVE